jgi:release factor glutamine methyltransferase
LQYIHGQVEFFSCHFKVTRDVLIPRQETEILIDKIYQELSPLSLHGKKLWDLCTGSGCMGIALKKKLPSLEVTLSDLSNGALAIAKENANLNEVVVNFLQGDLLAPFQGKKTDFVVCNPPYISENEFQTLDSEVKNFEPRMALVSGNSGLEFYERLAKELPSFLNRGAKVWLEIGAGQGNALLSLFDKGPWKQFRCEQDWAGHDRFFFLEIE